MGGENVEEALGPEVGRSWCPHLAMLLESLDQLHASVDEPPESWAEPWLPVIDERLGDGFDAVWWSRFPVGVTDPAFDLAVRYDAAWDEAMRDRRAVSLCVYIVGGESDAAAARLAGIHDGLLHVSGDGVSLTRTREH